MTTREHSLRRELDRVLDRYQRRDYLNSDPVSIPHQYEDSRDREMTGFLAAMMAFGNVRSMLPAIQQALGWLGPSPVARLLEVEEAELHRALVDFRYRWIGSADIIAFLQGMRVVYGRHEGLETLFRTGVGPATTETWDGLHALLEGLRTIVGARSLENYGTRYLLPKPHGKGAYKRAHLFLRWMIRGDVIDFGIWSDATPAQCIIPVDTHVARISALLGMTSRKSADGRMAQEITGQLRRLDPEDPVKYDFAISRLGILGACPRKPVEVTCEPCQLRSLCRHWG